MTFYDEEICPHHIISHHITFIFDYVSHLEMMFHLDKFCIGSFFPSDVGR